MKHLFFTVLLFFFSVAVFPLAGFEFFPGARWIWAEGDQKPDPARRKFKRSDARFEPWAPQKAYVRCVLNAKEPVKQACFYAFWDRSAAFYFNGKRLNPGGWHKLPRTFGHVKGRGSYLTKMFKKGRNVLAVEISRAQAGCYGLILRGEIEYVSGKKEYFISSSKYFKGSGKLEKNWNTAQFDDSKWKPAYEQGDVTMKPWSDYGNVPLLYCTAKEYAAYVKKMTNGFDDKYLRPEQKKKFKARIVYRNHLPGVEVNGKVIPPFTNTISGLTGHGDISIRETGKAGMRILRIPFNPVTANGDYAALDLAVRRALAANPDAYILLCYREIPTPGWMKKHPDELMGFALKSKSKSYTRYSANPDAPSYASKIWLAQMEKYIRDLAAFCLKQSWGCRILGVLNSHGPSGDGLPVGANSMPDTGKRMTEAFRRYLTDKYKTDAALQKSWGDSKVTLKNARVPDKDERAGSGMFLRDPGDGKDRRVIDYYTCYHKVFSNHILSQMKFIKKYFPGRLAGCFSGYIVLSYTPEGSTACFEEMLKSPYVDIMYGTTRGYNLTDGLHRHSHSVFHRYKKLSSIEADIRTHKDFSGEAKWRCATPEETRSTMSKVIANSFLNGSGYHLVSFGKHYIFNNPETLEPIRAGVQIWKKLFNAPPSKNSDTAVIIDHNQIWKQGHSNRFKNFPFADMLVTLTLQSLYVSGFSFDLLAPEDYLASRHTYRCVIFLNSFELTPARQKALLKKLRKPGVTAIWNYAPGIITPKGFSDKNMSLLTGISLRAVKKLMPFSARNSQGVQLAPSGTVLRDGPRVCSIDPKAEKLFAYSDKTGALVRKKLADGSTAVFAGIPVTSHTLWAELLKKAGCHSYAAPGNMVRSSSKLLLVFSPGSGKVAPESKLHLKQLNRSGKVTVKFDVRKDQVKELFTGKIYKTSAGKLDLVNSKGRPQVWLFEK